MLSSRTGNVLQTMTCNIANTNAGFDAFGLNDVDSDGKADFGITGNGVDAASIASFDGVVYVLGGKVASPPAGDMNCDDVVSVSDIGGFVLALTDPAQYAVQYPDCNLLAADVNHDLAVSVSDIGPFVTLLTGA